MDINNFFTFSSSLYQAPICVKGKGHDWDSYCRILQGDLTSVDLPVEFKQVSGKKWMDILDCSVSMYIVSTRFIELLEQHDITGWKTYPITLSDKTGVQVNGYTGFSVVGRCAPADYSKCETYEGRTVPTGSWNKYYKGLYVGLDEWDGSDFFIPEHTIELIITKKAKHREECYDQ